MHVSVCMRCRWQDGLKVSASRDIQLHPGAAGYMLTDCPVFLQTTTPSVDTQRKQTQSVTIMHHKSIHLCYIMGGGHS